ncbi:golgin subfamily A member 3-like [Anneissia japonica]|uniref:golgin subfamily A member 3-like n=1 Tax=Anneissia japonica TaxID=1529436 RepID=UPI001425699A|nr:golgin subfamily A member 3-like [Anneissia japonica]XP_033115992.1 golgin subfamily A member 3-like [Anneissia japonica]XP_033115998.1 golgin subfamily A member 3-like [Anneissia japonica]
MESNPDVIPDYYARDSITNDLTNIDSFELLVSYDTDIEHWQTRDSSTRGLAAFFQINSENLSRTSDQRQDNPLVPFSEDQPNLNQEHNHPRSVSGNIIVQGTRSLPSSNPVPERVPKIEQSQTKANDTFALTERCQRSNPIGDTFLDSDVVLVDSTVGDSSLFHVDDRNQQITLASSIRETLQEINQQIHSHGTQSFQTESNLSSQLSTYRGPLSESEPVSQSLNRSLDSSGIGSSQVSRSGTQEIVQTERPQALPILGEDFIDASDWTTARYLRIVTPQRDNSYHSEHKRIRQSSLGPSEGDPFDYLTSAGEINLLESPSEDSSFERLRLQIGGSESELEGSISEDLPNASQILTDKEKLLQAFADENFAALPSSPGKQEINRGQSIKKINKEISDLEKEIKNLVVEIYSGREPGFLPLPGSESGIESPQGSRYEGIPLEHTANFGLVNPEQNIGLPLNHSYSEKGIMSLEPKTSPDTSLTPVGTMSPGSSFGDVKVDSTAEAIALQKSVVGNSQVEPASPEQIAAVIAQVQRQMKQQPGSSPEPSKTMENNPFQSREHASSPTAIHTGVAPVGAHSMQRNLIPTPIVNGFSPPLSEEIKRPLVWHPPTNPPVQEDSRKSGEASESAQKKKSDGPPKPVTIYNRPRTLVGQNTGLAINSALGSSNHPGTKIERVLFRSPVQSVTRNTSGSVQKPDSKKGKKKPKTNGDVEGVKPNIRGTFVTVKASGESSAVVGMKDMSDGVIITQDNVNSDSENMRSFTRQPSNEKVVSLQEHVVKTDASKPDVKNTNSESPGTSFLGSILPWSKKQPASLEETRFTPLEEAKPSDHLSTSFIAKKTDKPDESVDMESVFHPDMPPMSSSTPVKMQPNDGYNSPNVKKQSEIPLQSSVEAQKEKQPRQKSIPPSQPDSQPSYLAPRTVDTIHANVPYTLKKKDLSKMPSTALDKPNTLHESRSESVSTVSSWNEHSDDIQAVLQEKARLEGQLEALSVETASALADRARLQTQIATLEAQVHNSQGHLQTALQEKSEFHSELEAIQMNRKFLEESISNLQNNIDGKEAALETLRDDLRSSQTSNLKLQQKLREIQSELQQREGNITNLQDRLQETQKDLDNAIENRAQAVAIQKTFETELRSMSKTKEWLQEQLKFAQEARNKLQANFAEAQNQVVLQGASMETLKTENARIRQQLSETQQKALNEKEQIAKHLETIEADMLAREAAFMDLQREKVAVQQAVATKMDQIQEEKHKLSHIFISTQDLEQQLERAQRDLLTKQAAMSALEEEKRELIRKFTLTQEAVNTRDHEVDTLKQQFDALEKRLKASQTEQTTQSDELHRLKVEKLALEAALATANDEKRQFDDAIQRLRQDMVKVEKGFKQMKQELGEKDGQLQVAQQESGHLKEQLMQMQQHLADEQKNVESISADVSGKNVMLDEFKQSKSQLEYDIAALKQELQKSHKAQQHETELKNAAQIEGQKLSEKLIVAQEQLQDVMKEKVRIEGQLEVMAGDQERLQKLIDDNNALKQKLAESQSSTHRDSAEQAATILRLTSDLNRARQEFKQKDNENKSTTEMLQRRLQDLNDEKQAAESSLTALQTKTELDNQEVKQQLAEELKSTKKQLSNLSATKNALERELLEVKEDSDVELDACREKINQLEEELLSANKALDNQKKITAESRKLALDLERERGRLAGVKQSHAHLKNHASALESALAKQESSLTVLQDELYTRSSMQKEDANKNKRRFMETQESLDRDQDIIKTLKKELSNERSSTAKLKRQLEEMSTEFEILKKEFDSKASENLAMRSSLQKEKEIEEKQKGELEAVRHEVQRSRARVGQLEKLLQEKNAQNPIQEDTIKALKWQYEQKVSEVEAMKEQLEMAEERQQIEITSINAALKLARTDLDGLKSELATTRKEKFSYKNKLAEVKAALKATAQQNKLLKAKLLAKKNLEKKAKAQAEAEAGKQKQAEQLQQHANQPQDKLPHQHVQKQIEPILSSAFDDVIIPEVSYDVDALISSEDTDTPTAEKSRPLQALQGCLQNLKDQMSQLQHQMDDHTVAVNSSHQTWKEVKSSLNGVKEACMKPIDQNTSPAAQRPSTAHQSSSPAPNLPNVYNL